MGTLHRANSSEPWVAMFRGASPRLREVLLFALAYFGCAELGVAFSFPSETFATFWPPGGLLLAVLIASPTKQWPRFLAASLGAEIISDAGFHHTPLAASLAFGAGHLLEAVVGAWLICRFIGTPFRCSTIREALGLVFLGSVISATVGATFSASVLGLMSAQGSYWPTWSVCWSSGSLGILLVAPLLLIGNDPEEPAVRDGRWIRSLERTAALFLLLAVTQFVFSRTLPRTTFWQFPYLALVPFILWISLRFDPRSQAIAIALVALLTVWHTRQGKGPVNWIGQSTAQRAFLIQSYLVAMSLTALVFSAIATGRRLAERRLRASEEDSRRSATFLQAILDAAHYTIISTDRDGIIRAYNAAAERTLGYSSNEVVGQRTPEFLHDPAEVAARADELSRELGVVLEPGFEVLVARARRGEHEEREWSYLRRDGSRFPVRLSVTALRDQQGTITGFLGIGQDVTETKAAEEALRRARDELEMRVDERTADLARANALLREGEERFRQLADSMPQIVWTARPDGYLDYFNARWYEFTGFSRGQGGDSSWLPILHPDDVQSCVDCWYHAVRKGVSYEIEYRFKDRNTGLYRWHLGRALPVHDDAGRVVRWFGTCTDIDDLKRMEEALRESEARQSRALAAARIGHWEWDAQADRVTYQDSLPTLYGRGEDQPFTSFSDFLSIVHPDDRDRFHATALSALTPGVPYEAEYRVVWPDGSIHWLATRGGASFDETGTPARMVGVNLDITERKDAEAQIRRLNETLERRVVERTAELRQSEERFRGAFDTAAIGMALVAPNGRWLQVNRSLCRIVGCGEAELLAMKIQDLIHPDDLEACLDQMSRLLSGELPAFHLEKRFVHKEGQVLWVLLTASLVRDGAGVPLHLVAQIKNITGRKQAEEELCRARDEAMAAMRAKGEFLANMSHEIRTPMNGVLGMTELLLDTPLSDHQRDYAEIIHSSGEALLTVINDILDFSKIEAGKMTLDVVPFDLRGLMEEVADLLAPRAHQKGLLIACRVDHELPALVEGDPVRIRQVLTNLAGNAVKFTDQGEVQLEARLLSETPRDTTLRIVVRDTGIGIPRERQADVFESFTQVDGGNNRKYGGTGLGLTICRRLVDLMGGRIGLESALGKGCEFWFELSLGKGAPAVEDAGAGSTRRLDLTAVERLRVLVIDDQPTNRAVLREALLAWKCRPEEAGSGTEALAMLQACPADDPFQLVLLDQDMPDMDGEETARAIKTDSRFADLPLVRMASLGAPKAGQPLEPTLFLATLTKPVRRAPLANLLGRVVAAPAGESDCEPLGALPPETRQLSVSLRVLLAEDNAINRRVAAGMVERLGCQIVAVGNGLEAVEAIEHEHYDLILMDVQMPEMDGFAATAAIRAKETPAERHIPIIAMTAHAMHGDRERCLAAGMDGYLTKPLRLGPLREILADWGIDRARPLQRPSDPRPSARSPFDPNVICEACGGDDALVREVLGMMLGSIPGRLDRLDVNAALGDLRRVAWEAHGVKGVFLTVGSEVLAGAFQELIRHAERGDHAGIAATLLRIRDQWSRFRDGARRYLESQPVAVLQGTG